MGRLNYRNKETKQMKTQGRRIRKDVAKKRIDLIDS